jgi:hypothetical protein
MFVEFAIPDDMAKSIASLAAASVARTPAPTDIGAVALYITLSWTAGGGVNGTAVGFLVPALEECTFAWPHA